MVNRHLQSVGTATCDVSNMILQAESCGKGPERIMLMSAAREVLNLRQKVRRLTAFRLSRKHFPIKRPTTLKRYK